MILQLDAENCGPQWSGLFIVYEILDLSKWCSAV